ncbi:MAG: hypothetical protein HYY16_00465 [Planctomycetes bacterium]|nr:hypothetical protein [Planctomycetota bacterium]
MKRLMMAAAIALAAPAAAFAGHDDVTLIGTVIRECHDEFVLAVEDCNARYRLRGDVCRLAGKRVEVIGRLSRRELCVSEIHELLPCTNDLIVTVDVSYRGRGELFLGYQPAGWFDRERVRSARRVRCGDRVTLRMPVRCAEAHWGVRYEVVLYAVERQSPRDTCSSRSMRTVMRHERSETFTYGRGRWRGPCGRPIRAARVSLCL